MLNSMGWNPSNKMILSNFASIELYIVVGGKANGGENKVLT